MKITVIGTNLHADTLQVGGVPLRQGVSREITVDEGEFIRLISGMKSGWFKIQSHNYGKFLDTVGKPIHYDVDQAFLNSKGLSIYAEPVIPYIATEPAVNEVPESEVTVSGDDGIEIDFSGNTEVATAEEVAEVDAAEEVAEVDATEEVAEVDATEEVAEAEEAPKKRRGRKSKTSETEAVEE